MEQGKMQILAMDTATTACSVALWSNGAIVSHRLSEIPRGQAEALAPMLAAVLDDANVDAGDLDLLAVTVGPGAFTGLRIGLAMARAMALAVAVPCFGLTTTEVIAHAVFENTRPNTPLLVAIDSKRSDIYVQIFSKLGHAACEPQAVEPEKLDQCLSNISGSIAIVGDATPVVIAALSEKNIDAFPINAPGIPDAWALATLAARRWKIGDSLTMPAPLYLRPPDAKLPRDGGKLRP
jgi:tRNA threonylcarbamoyladenosine biosynthesis protein TsaB